MYQKTAIRIPDAKGKITYQTQNKIKYVYFERERNYDADRQFNVPKRSCIGKVVPGIPRRCIPMTISLFSFRILSFLRSMKLLPEAAV